MTTINVYENTNSKDDNVNITDISEIKEILTEILNETRILNKKLSSENNVIDEKDNENITIDDVLNSFNKNIIKEDNNDNVKNLRKEEIENRILELLPMGDKDYEKELIEKYSNSSNKKSILNNVWTIKQLLKEFNLKRYELERILWRNDDSLVSKGLIKKFNIQPDNVKAPRVFYKVDVNKVESKPKKRMKLKDSDKFKIVQNSAKKLYSDMRITEDGEIEFKVNFNNHENVMSLRYDIYDVLYIKSVVFNENYTMGDFKKLVNMDKNWSRVTLFRLIYNLENNDEFNKLLDDYVEKNFIDVGFSKKGDIIKINGKLTYIPVHQAKSWCTYYVNNNYTKEEIMWRLQKRFKEYKKEDIACIILNITDDVLSTLWGSLNVKSDFVENNPSKRKDLISSGVLIK